MRMCWRSCVGAAAFTVVLGAGCEQPGPERPGPERVVVPPETPEVGLVRPALRPAQGENRPRTVYVPAYSHLPADNPTQPDRKMSILLSVRNIDTSTEIVLTAVDYFDTSGHRVRSYLTEPTALRPLETAEFAVATRDLMGGSGANFLVYWEGPSDAHPLLTETVMIHRSGTGLVAFTSRGEELDRRPDSDAFGDLADGGPAESAP